MSKNKYIEDLSVSLTSVAVYNVSASCLLCTSLCVSEAAGGDDGAVC